MGTIVMAALGLATSAVTTLGGMAVERRRGKRAAPAAKLADDRLALTARDALLDRLQDRLARAEGSLDEARDEREECLRLHRECLTKADRMAGRIAHLEERLDAVEQRSGDSTPVPGDRS